MAEVLITLGIIGVVAAFTIPTLMNNAKEQEFKTAYKKAYSVANQAWSSAVANDEISVTSSWHDPTNCQTNFNAFKAKFKIIKDCNSNNNSQCWNSVGDKWGGEPLEASWAFETSDGMVWSAGSTPDLADSDIFVDTNGLKTPNQLGKDRFVFHVICGGNESYPCTPTRVTLPPSDILSNDSTMCPHAPCYYTSWILN